MYHSNIYEDNSSAKYVSRGNNILTQSDMDYSLFPQNGPAEFQTRLKNPLFLKTLSCGMRIHQFFNSMSFRPWNDFGQWSTLRKPGAPHATGPGFPEVHKTRVTTSPESTFIDYEYTNRLDECSRADVAYAEYEAYYKIQTGYNVYHPIYPPPTTPVWLISPWLDYDAVTGSWDIGARANIGIRDRPPAVNLRDTLGYWQEYERGVHPYDFYNDDMTTRAIDFVPPTGDFQFISNYCLFRDYEIHHAGQWVGVICAQNSLTRYIPTIKRSRNIMVFNVKAIVYRYFRVINRMYNLDQLSVRQPQPSIFSIDCSYDSFDKNLTPHYSEDSHFEKAGVDSGYEDVPERNNPMMNQYNRHWRRSQGSICTNRASKSGFVTLLGNMIHASFEWYSTSHEKFDDNYANEAEDWTKDYLATPQYSIGVKGILPFHVDLGMCASTAQRQSTGIIENQAMPSVLKESMLYPLVEKDFISPLGVCRSADPDLEDTCITPPFPPTPAPPAAASESLKRKRTARDEAFTEKYDSSPVKTLRLDSAFGAASGARLEQTWQYSKMDVMQPVRKQSAVPGIYLNDCCLIDFKYMWTISSHKYDLGKGNSYTTTPIVDSDGEPELNSDGALLCAILGKPWGVYVIRGRKEWERATIYCCNSAIHNALKEHMKLFPDEEPQLQKFADKYYPLGELEREEGVEDDNLTIDERTKGAKYGIDMGPDQIFDGILVTNANELDLTWGTGMYFRNPHTDPDPHPDMSHGRFGTWERTPTTDDITVFWPMPEESTFAAPYNVLYLYSDIVQPVAIGAVQEAPLVTTVLLSDVPGSRIQIGDITTSGYNRACELERKGTPLDLILQQISYPTADKFTNRRRFADGTVATFYDYVPNPTTVQTVYKESKPTALNTKNINTLSFYILDRYGHYVPFHPDSATHIEFYIENNVE